MVSSLVKVRKVHLTPEWLVRWCCGWRTFFKGWFRRKFQLFFIMLLLLLLILMSLLTSPVLLLTCLLCLCVADCPVHKVVLAISCPSSSVAYIILRPAVRGRALPTNLTDITHAKWSVCKVSGSCAKTKDNQRERKNTMQTTRTRMNDGRNENNRKRTQRFYSINSREVKPLATTLTTMNKSLC